MFKRPFWLDASSLIQASRHRYPPKTAGYFWSFLGGEITKGSVCAPRQVFQEIADGDDYLKRWTHNRRAALCTATGKQVQDEYKKIAHYVRQSYAVPWIEEFLDGGDAWVIACAMASGGTVVTEESTSRKDKIRIPVICQHFQHKWTDTDGLLLDLNASFLNTGAPDGS